MRRLVADGVDDGLIQRMNMIMLRDGVLGKDEPTSQEADHYDSLIEQLHQLSPQIGRVLRFDSTAQEIRQQLEQKHLDLHLAYKNVNRKLSAHFGKYNGMFARLCLLFHCIEHRENVYASGINADTAQRVADFMHDFLRPHAIAFYTSMLGLSDDHDRLCAVAGYILAHNKETITKRDIARGDRTMRKLTERDTNSIFEQLEALSWISRGNTRLTSQVRSWAVNPQVHAVFKERAEQEAERRQQQQRLIAEEGKRRRGKSAS